MKWLVVACSSLPQKSELWSDVTSWKLKQNSRYCTSDKPGERAGHKSDSDDGPSAYHYGALCTNFPAGAAAPCARPPGGREAGARARSAAEEKPVPVSGAASPAPARGWRGFWAKFKVGICNDGEFKSNINLSCSAVTIVKYLPFLLPTKANCFRWIYSQSK